MSISPDSLSMLLSRLPVSLFEIDAGTRFVSVEGGFVRAFNSDECSQAPRSLLSLAPEHADEIHAALEPGGHSHWVSFSLNDGEPCWTEFLVCFNEHKEHGAIGLAIDLTEEYRSDQLNSSLARSRDRSTRLESMGYLISLLSNDLYSYLSVAAGNLRSVQRQLPEQTHPARRIEVAFEAMDRATQTSQKLARSIRPRAPIMQKTVIRETLERTLAQLRASLDACFQIELVVSKDVPILWADPDQVSEIVRALVLNAAEAMPDGGLIMLESDRVIAENGSGSRGARQELVRISINDGGTGIPEAMIERVFDPCWSTKVRRDGLGLTRAHALASAHRGYLSVRSDPGAGSTFEVYLPVAQSIPKTVENAASALGGPPILVFDPCEDVRITLEKTLRACGHETECFGDLQAAFAAWRARSLAENPYRLVVLGWGGGPGAAGRTLWRDILAADARARGVALAPFGARMGAEEIAASRLLDALRQPLSLDQVRQVVGEALRPRARRPA